MLRWQILRMMNSVFVLKLDFSFHNNDSLFLLFQMVSIAPRACLLRDQAARLCPPKLQQAPLVSS